MPFVADVERATLPRAPVLLRGSLIERNGLAPRAFRGTSALEITC